MVPSPDPIRHTVPKAFVALTQGHEPTRELAGAILSYVANRLAPYKRVRRLEFAELPKTVSGKIRLTSNAVVNGNLVYWSDHAASIDKSAKVTGAVTQKIPAEIFRPSAKKMLGVIGGFILFVKIISFISTLILGLLFIYFFPSYSRAVVSTISNRPLASLGSGFLVFILTPSVVLFLLITVVGIPLALILSAAYFIGIYLVRIFAIFWVGVTLFERLGKRVGEGWALVLGLVVYSILTLIPFIGGLVALFVILFGLGAAILADRELYLAAREKEMI